MKKFTWGERLNRHELALLKAFSKDCRAMILGMLRLPQSGHPGGSLSSIDFLTLLYAGIIARSGERVVISNGHISPAVYSVLAELGLVDRAALLKGFRRPDSVFEGHVSRRVAGVEYGTGPLGIGVGVAAGMAWAEKDLFEHGRGAGRGLSSPAQRRRGGSARGAGPRRVYAIMGDGEAQEGEVYEMCNFAAARQLDNLIVICDDNGIQLSGAIRDILPFNLGGHFRAAGWLVLEADGHDFRSLWRAYRRAQRSVGKPVLILAKTVMGRGVAFMEEEARAGRSTWHGKAPSPQQIDALLPHFALNPREQKVLASFLSGLPPDFGDFVRRSVNSARAFAQSPAVSELPRRGNPGRPRLYEAGEELECRTAYSQALLDLAKSNPRLVALTADLRESVKTGLLAEHYPARHLECGIAEQLMVSLAGGLSLCGYLPFVSTYAVFFGSRARDQVRVNDINATAVKMVATHSGISVGEDGPTHQAIDDFGSLMGFFNTRLLEPADANQTDRMLRHLVTHDGNYYLRLGRQKLPIVTRPDGKPFYGLNYRYRYGRSDLLRRGRRLTVLAMGAMVHAALGAWEQLSARGKAFDLLAVTSPRDFDATLLSALRRNPLVLTVEDHNPDCGLYSQIAILIQRKKLPVKLLDGIGVRRYQQSGTWQELYARAGLDAKSIVRYIDKAIK
jgi:transketolase